MSGTDLSEEAWASVSFLIHPKGVQCELGQSSVQDTCLSSFTLTLVKHVFIDLALYTGTLS